MLFFGPAFAVHTLYRLYREQQEATDELTDVNARLERANISFASALVAALDARDRYTAGHSAAVAVYARDIAARLQLSEEQQQLAHLCGLVHDIGKVGLPPGILEKPGALTLEERRMMEEHSVIGERILANVDDYAEIAKIVRHHHERMDGNGYPDAIPGDEIPLISRIIAVADAYNAMTSGRPYRDAMPTRVARFRLAQAASTQFDTTIVAAFEAILAGSKESYLSGLSADFGVEVQRQPSMRPLAVAQTGLIRRTVASRVRTQRRLETALDPKLLKYVVDVGFGRARADHERVRDVGIRESLANEVEYLYFPWSQHRTQSGRGPSTKVIQSEPASKGSVIRSFHDRTQHGPARRSRHIYEDLRPDSVGGNERVGCAVLKRCASEGRSPTPSVSISPAHGGNEVCELC